jgi:hypothetical protein
MNKLILIILFGSLLFTSCTKCITCQIQGHSLNDSTFADTQIIDYDEFCGTLTELEAFEGDVKFNAENRACVSYTVRKYSTDEVLSTFHACGGINQLQEFKTYLEEEVLDGTYVGQDVYLKTEVTVPNPGTYSCK